ncbi:hypothetical protein C7999DRAFT_32782 [Corynascus novoguineensis]|uniref:Uncharacterized protein n=1 Tax=Corynascus novoguineensis TaxID=1126955 RepID=A0AAN7HEQ5_9PEZI|nr:hypothetical protein C7999DRAFT_32782 [Corynascus novoguineensis]
MFPNTGHSVLSLSILILVVSGTSATTPTVTQPPAQYTIPCTIGDDSPCHISPGWTCTPTQVCTTNVPCGGLCINPPVVPCTVGNDAPCPTGSTCTPTTYSTPGALLVRIDLHTNDAVHKWRTLRRHMHRDADVEVDAGDAVYRGPPCAVR